MKFVKTMDSLHPADEEAASFLVQAPEGATLEFKAITNQRSEPQNKALHAWLRDLAKALNNSGFDLLSFPWKEGVEIPWSLELCKERLWLPVQEVVTSKRRTSELTTAEVDQVYQPLAKKIAGMGVDVPPLGRE